jgi:ribosomal-protein-alanine N-acetyltransferase
MLAAAMEEDMNPDGLGTGLPTLTGDGVVLRWITLDDTASVLELFSDIEVIRYTTIQRMESEADSRGFIAEIHESFAAGTLYQWGAEVDGRIAGICTLAGIDRMHRRASLGFALAREFWGRRVMSRAVPLVLDFGFHVLALHRIEADADPRNTASIRLLERLGFVHEGHLRERYFQLGEAQDAVVFGMLRSEWRRA